MCQKGAFCSHFEIFLNIVLSNIEITEYRQRIGIKDSDFVIGKLGRPHVAKWSDLLLDMMPYVVRLIPNIKFVIQAAPKYRIEKIRNEIDELEEDFLRQLN